MTRFRHDAYWKDEGAPDSEAGPRSDQALGSPTCLLVSPTSGHDSGRGLDRSEPVAVHDELAALAAAAGRGDPVAVRTLLTTLMPQLLRVVRRVLGPGHPELEDVAYEAAHALLQGLGRFRGEGTVRHYACRVAAFTAINVRRRDAAHKRSHERDPFDIELCEAGGPGPEQQALSASLRPMVRELVATLPQALAEALTLHVILGYTVQEISRACHVPAETVRSRLRLARQALRKRVLGNPVLLEALEVEA